MEDLIGKWSVAKLELKKVPLLALAAKLNRSRSQFAILNHCRTKPERVVCLGAGFAGNDQFKAKGVTSFKTE